jgi:hypothetical protein
VEWLKVKALSSSLSTAKKEEKRKKEKEVTANINPPMRVEPHDLTTFH